MEESESAAAMINQSRKEKRKALKKMKRKQTRKEIALKHLNEQVSDDNEEQDELEEAKRMSESVRLIFEERERAWLQALEIRNKRKQQQQEEELSRNQQQIETAKENDDDDDEWEYVEDGPAEIIFNGNEITIKKKTVKVPKRNNSPKPNSTHEGADRPTSNPLPPQSLAFDDYKKSSLSAQQMIDTVAEQVPHFGTEQDKDHCPFHLKTGACRFGQHCSRVHFYPNRSCTLLIKNMYNGPGLTWEHDDGLEVCRNGASHLRGNVYVQYSALESALLAHQYINGRYFAGKQISCEFINVTRWKVAICGEYVKSRYKTCSRGTACNFIHCFCNPGGDYEWADSDRPPPKYWVEKIVALFGYSDAYRKQIREDNTGQLRNSRMSMTDSRRYIVRRSRSRDRSYSSSTGSGRRYDNEYFTPKGTSHRRSPGEDNTYMKDYNHRKDPKHYIESDGKFLDTDEYMDRDARHGHRRKSSGQEKRTRRSSSEQEKPGLCHDGDREKIDHQVGGDRSTRYKNRELYRDSRKSSGHKRRVGYERKDHKSKSQDSDGEWSDSISSGDEHHGTSKSSVRIGDTSERSKERENSRRSCTTEFSGNSGHARRSKHWDKVTDNNRYPTQDVKHIAEAEAPVKRLKPDNGRCTSDVQIDKQDRWEPGNHSEGNAGSSESHESSDYVSKLNYDDNISKGEHWCEAGEVTSSKHQKARRRSTKSNGEHEHGKRSRGSNKSNSSDAVMDPSEDNESRVLNKHLASHGAGDQKRHHKKRSRE